jgi:hypothetical protein
MIGTQIIFFRIEYVYSFSGMFDYFKLDLMQHFYNSFFLSDTLVSIIIWCRHFSTFPYKMFPEYTILKQKIQFSKISV